MASKTRHDRAELLAAALARGATVRAAARAAGYSERQAHRMLARPGFQEHVAALRSRIIGRTVALLAGAGTEAARTLRTLLRSADDRIRLAAARSILELGDRLRLGADLDERMTQLEERLELIQAQPRLLSLEAKGIDDATVGRSNSEATGPAEGGN